MQRVLEILDFIEQHLQRRPSVVLLVVAESSGSSPGRKGFKMAVSADGALFGSIGGGLMEVNLVETAREFLTVSDDRALEKFGHRIFFSRDQIHRNVPQFSSGMICSGEQLVLFLKFKRGDLENIRSVKSSLGRFEKSILEITVSGLRLITPGMDLFDGLWTRAGEHVSGQPAADLVYLEKLGVRNDLSIIGGGHCALALSELMSKLDFHISLFDDRADLNTLAKNSYVDEKTVIGSYERIGEFIDGGKNSYVAVMTLGYKFDEIVIRKLIGKEFRYFGVLGSRAKMKTLLNRLEKDGFDPNLLKRIHAPIGLPINSRTPEEIAVSIAAEIIAVKNSK